MTVYSKRSASGLRQACLSYPEILSQSVGHIAPVAMVSVTAPLVIASAGKGTWLAFLIATIGLVLVGLNIKQFARRSASPGALYTYIARGMGPLAGVISGWSLLLAYLGAASNGLAGFAMSANLVLDALGFRFSPFLLYAICAGVAWFYAYIDIQQSTVLMLFLEVTSACFILILAVLVLFGHGFAIDTSQLSLEGVSPSGLGLGMVLAIFCYVGFESSTVLGEEAQRPLWYIPRSVIWSTVLAGLFYIILSYTEVLGFTGYNISLSKSSNISLSVLAELTGVSWLGTIISFGIVFSFLVTCLAAINAGARIFYTMARHTIFHPWLGEVHPQSDTPHIGVTISALLVFLVPTFMSLSGIQILDVYGYSGTIATYGFLLVYILVSIAAPIYLSRLGKLRPINMAISVLGIIFMLIPVIGSLYPVPPTPYSWFPYLFLVYLAVGGGWFLMLRLRSPKIIKVIEHDLEVIHAKFSSKVG